MSEPVPRPASLSTAAFATLLLIALLMGANHVAARVAFNHGVDVATAVVFRSSITALVVGGLLVVQGVPMRLSAKHRRALPAIGVLIAVQSLCLYSSVARLPVALALLAFNTYPLWTALWARLVYGHRPERRVLLATGTVYYGIALGLRPVPGGDVHAGLADALTGSLPGGIPAMGVVLVGVAVQGGFHLPDAAAGWWGLVGLTLLYGTGFTIMFTVLPRLGVVGNSAIMNVEPIFALVLAWAVLGQSIAPSQVAGGLVVVATVMWLGLRRR